MSDAAIFVSFFGGIVIARVTVATLVFMYLLPRTCRCPHCDAVTLRVERKWWNRLMPWLRTSWCYQCGWEGKLRHAQDLPASATYSPAKRRERVRRK